jgi:hypothetical protein
MELAMMDLQQALREIDEVIARRIEARAEDRPSAAQALYLIDRIVRQTLDRDHATAPIRGPFKLSA